MLGVAGQCIATAINHMLRSTYAFYSAVHHAEIVPMMPSFDQPVRLGDTHLIPHIIQRGEERSEEHTSDLQSLMRISYAVFCLKKNTETHHVNQQSITAH